jgi:hypothetical protein
MFGYFTSFDVIILRIDKLSYGYVIKKNRATFMKLYVLYIHFLWREHFAVFLYVDALLKLSLCSLPLAWVKQFYFLSFLVAR